MVELLTWSDAIHTAVQSSTVSHGSAHLKLSASRVLPIPRRAQRVMMAVSFSFSIGLLVGRIAVKIMN